MERLTNADEARDALAAMTAAKRQLADIAQCPPWRHAAFAGLEATLVASPVLPVLPRAIVFLAVIIGIALLIRSDRKRLGVFINGYRRGRTRVVTSVLLCAVVAMLLTSMWASHEAGLPQVSVALGVLTFILCWIGSVKWQRVFVAEMTGA